MQNKKMDDLVSQFMRQASLTTECETVNPTPFHLVYTGSGRGVYTTCSYIHKDTIIGEIHGQPAYIWELNHSHYIIIDREYVLDTSSLPYPRSMLTYVREENDTNNMANCTIDSLEDGSRHFLRATMDIPPNTELVYFVLSRMYL